MRKLIICIVAGLIFAGCEDAEGPSALPEHGYISAKMNAVSWEGQTVASLRDDSLRIHGAGNDYHLEFKLKFNGIGSYELTGSQAVYNGIEMGDIGTDHHNIAPGETGVLIITDYITEARTFKGTFQLKLTAVDGDGEINFTEGKVDGIIAAN
jgi:hypothetical protein